MQEEISLREVIKITWRGKWVIILGTIFLMSVTGFFCFFILDPTYEAATTVMVNNQINEKQQQTVKKELAPFVEQVKNSFFLDKIMNEMQLDPQKYTLDALRESINVETIKDSNFIRVKVKGSEPKIITNIANVISYELSSLIEISSSMDLIVNANKDLMETEDQLKIYQNQLDSALKMLETTPDKLNTEKSLAGDPYLQSVLKDLSGLSNKSLGSLQLNNEEINPIYIGLKSKVSELSIEVSKLQTEKQNFKARISSNQAIIAERQKQIKEIDLNLTNTLNGNENNNNAILITPAIEPKMPLTQGKLLTLIFAGLAGIVCSLFLVFFREYWKNSNNRLEVRQVDKNVE
ncbi:Wzz/FepE/Etk N-terminal domain-containing protein [Paenibacillus sp. 2RAB27]|uniref:Wzz/FepE/Etk N-terminal domain-containing protein n=1 Tax=Paenibacillus sp. 2RAB27 TaxID=3232991 RepID=UPI003F9C6CDD